jgi:hypothetical protein
VCGERVREGEGEGEKRKRKEKKKKSMPFHRRFKGLSNALFIFSLLFFSPCLLLILFFFPLASGA